MVDRVQWNLPQGTTHSFRRWADFGDPNAPAQIEAVRDTLAELEVDHLPLVVAMNKSDLPAEAQIRERLMKMEPLSVQVSAVTGTGIEQFANGIDIATSHFYIPHIAM